MDLFEAIRERTSYRGNYLMDKVPYGDLKKIVQAGMDAPSGRNLQTTSFVVVDDENQLLEIAKIMPSRSVASAPAVIVAAFGEDDPDDIFSSEREDCAAAVQNMLLAITAMGYASCWIDGELKLEGRAEKISSLLHLPAGITAHVILPVGKAAASPKKRPKLSFEQRACRNHCGK